MTIRRAHPWENLAQERTRHAYDGKHREARVAAFHAQYKSGKAHKRRKRKRATVRASRKANRR